MRMSNAPYVALAALAFVFAAPAQEARELPAPGSPAATALVDTAIAKMLAVGRGTFRSVQKDDSEGPVQVGAIPGSLDVVVEGGWERDFVWGARDGNRLLRHRGRTVTPVGTSWKLRADSFADDSPYPFVLDPALLFTVLQGLPAEARRGARVERGKVKERDVVVLTLEFEGDAANEIGESGALPPCSSGSSAVFVLRGMGQPNKVSGRATFVAMAVDPDNGDVLRLGIRRFEKNQVMRAVRVVRGGNGNAPAPEAEPPPPWQDGLPTRAPEAGELSVTWIVEFPKLGLTDRPRVEDEARSLLRLP